MCFFQECDHILNERCVAHPRSQEITASACDSCTDMEGAESLGRERLVRGTQNELNETFAIHQDTATI